MRIFFLDRSRWERIAAPHLYVNEFVRFMWLPAQEEMALMRKQAL